MTTAPTMPVAVAKSAQVTSAATASEPGSPREAICSDAEQAVHDVGALDDVAHEQEQRDRRQRVVPHDRVGPVHEEVEDAVAEERAEVGPYPSEEAGILAGEPVVGGLEHRGVVIGVVAKADAERHQRVGDRKAQHDREDEDAELEDGDFRIGHRALSRHDHVDRLAAVPQRLQALLLHQQLLQFLDVARRRRPRALAQADDAAHDLRDALDEEEDSGDDDHRLELVDRNVGGAHRADFEVAPRARHVFPAGEDQRQHARKEEEEIEDELQRRLRARAHETEEDVRAHMRVARQRVGAAEHEQRAVHHVGDVEGPDGRLPEDVADEDFVGDAERHHHDAPGERLGDPRGERVGKTDVVTHSEPPPARSGRPRH